jgi:6-phosphogluconolactonase (cycloisomerase 2 family)
MRNSSCSRLEWLRAALAAAVAWAGAWEARGDDVVNAPEAVYALTNEPTGNRLAVFARDDRGMLTPAGLVPTGGAGTGQNTRSQGGLAFSDDQQFIYAVNSGDDTITVFSLTPTGPVPVQRIQSGGQLPVSLAVRDDLLYVLNAGSVAGGVDNIAGFRVDPRGFLSPLPGSSRPLSAPSTGPAQIGFSGDGGVLIVTERNTNLITTYKLDGSGRAGQPQPMPSSGATPFGFRVNSNGFLIVSEAGDPGSVSSYDVNARGTLEAISRSAPTEQNAPCWIGVTEDGKYAYAINAGSGSITGYTVGNQGALTQLKGDGGIFLTGGTAPTEVAIIRSQILYVLLRDSGGIGVFAIGADGTLFPIQNLEGVLPATTFANGLLAH